MQEGEFPLYYPQSLLFSNLDGLSEDQFDIKDYDTKRIASLPGGEDQITISQYISEYSGNEFIIEGKHWRSHIPHRIQTFLYIPNKFKILWIFQASEQTQITEEDTLFSTDYTNGFMEIQFISPHMENLFIEQFKKTFKYKPIINYEKDFEINLMNFKKHIYNLRPIENWIPSFCYPTISTQSNNCIIFSAKGTEYYSIENLLQISSETIFQESTLDDLLCEIKQYLPDNEHRLVIFPLDIPKDISGTNFIRQTNKSIVFLRWKGYLKAQSHYRDLVSAAVGYVSVLISNYDELTNENIFIQINRAKCMRYY